MFKLSMSHRYTYQLVYGASVLFLVAVPGSALVAAKALLMLLLTAATGIRIISSGPPRVKLLHLLFWICFILMWTIVGIVNNDDVDALREGVAYLSFMLFVYCFVVGLQWISLHFLVRVLIAGVISYSALKFGVLLGVILGFIDPVEFYWWLNDVASGVDMSGFWEGGMPRITMANDYVLPMILLLVLIGYARREISGLLFWISFSAIILLIAVTISRYLYIFSAAVLFMFLLLHILNRRVFKLGMYVLFVGLVTVPMLLVQMGYADRILSRFGGADAASSDATKLSQVMPIINMIDSSKLIGHGFGLSMASAGRGDKSSFQAELQWLALTAKVGLAGLAVVLAALMFYTIHLLFFGKSDKRTKILLAVTWPLWLLAGFFNPVMLLTTTAVNYLIFHAISMNDQQKTRYA